MTRAKGNAQSKTARKPWMIETTEGTRPNTKQEMTQYIKDCEDALKDIWFVADHTDGGDPEKVIGYVVIDERTRNKQGLCKWDGTVYPTVESAQAEADKLNAVVADTMEVFRTTHPGTQARFDANDRVFEKYGLSLCDRAFPLSRIVDLCADNAEVMYHVSKRVVR